MSILEAKYTGTGETGHPMDHACVSNLLQFLRKLKVEIYKKPGLNYSKR
jgi:hypothetical protein